jgi:hypothetical protein
VLLRAHIRGPRGILPTAQFAGDKAAEIRRAAARGRHALLVELHGDASQADDAIYVRVEPAHRLGRRPGRGEQADRGQRLESRTAGFRDARQVAKMRIALGAAVPALIWANEASGDIRVSYTTPVTGPSTAGARRRGREYGGPVSRARRNSKG